MDLVLMITVRGEVPTPTTTIAEVARVLRPHGMFTVSEHVPDRDYQPFRRVRQWCEERGLGFAAHYGHAWSYTANFKRR